MCDVAWAQGGLADQAAQARARQRRQLWPEWPRNSLGGPAKELGVGDPSPACNLLFGAAIMPWVLGDIP